VARFAFLCKADLRHFNNSDLAGEADLRAEPVASGAEGWFCGRISLAGFGAKRD
jgi:hypothetical protein